VALGGTDSHLAVEGLPPSVAAAVARAREQRFEKSCRVAHGRLLAVLAGGIGPGLIGETGTGCGVGLGWLASGADAEARLVSVEVDAARAEAAREGAGDARVTVLADDWTALAARAPFDLLVLDGGGGGKELLLAKLQEADRIDWSRAPIDSSHVRAFGGAPRPARARSTAPGAAPSTI
jgi:predicted O-methyltransferase YrrM